METCYMAMFLGFCSTLCCTKRNTVRAPVSPRALTLSYEASVILRAHLAPRHRPKWWTASLSFLWYFGSRCARWHTGDSFQLMDRDWRQKAVRLCSCLRTGCKQKWRLNARNKSGFDRHIHYTGVFKVWVGVLFTFNLSLQNLHFAIKLSSNIV